jgi:hypothetical protein
MRGRRTNPWSGLASGDLIPCRLTADGLLLLKTTSGEVDQHVTMNIAAPSVSPKPNCCAFLLKDVYSLQMHAKVKVCMYFFTQWVKTHFPMARNKSRS